MAITDAATPAGRVHIRGDRQRARALDSAESTVDDVAVAVKWVTEDGSQDVDFLDSVARVAFTTEKTRYEKTILSDLQGAWGVLHNWHNW